MKFGITPEGSRVPIGVVNGFPCEVVRVDVPRGVCGLLPDIDNACKAGDKDAAVRAFRALGEYRILQKEIWALVQETFPETPCLEWF